MSEQAGPSVAAVRARQAALADQHGAVTEADRILTETFAEAHAAMRESVRRLDAIGDEIDGAVLHQTDLAIDTPLGAREFRNFLLAKQRDIATVVTQAQELDRAKTAVLQRLRSQYSGSDG